jgi:hypothetical protein
MSSPPKFGGSVIAKCQGPNNSRSEYGCRMWLLRNKPDETIDPPGKNWPQAFYKRHPELKPKRVKALDRNRHDNYIYNKITHWFEVIGKELYNPVILLENIYNMYETGVILSILGSLKVLVGKDDSRTYRGAGVKRSTIYLQTVGLSFH